MSLPKAHSAAESGRRYSEPMASNLIRLAVRDDDSGARSAVWNFWTSARKSDVYVAARAHAGIFKVSLHESGECHMGYIASYQDPHPREDRSRHWDRWTRSKLDDSVSLGLSLIIAPEAIREDHPDMRKPVQWMPAPPEGKGVELTLLFAPHACVESIPGPEVGFTQLVNCGLPNGEVFWIVGRPYDLPRILIEKVERQKTSADHAPFVTSDSPTQPGKSLVALSCGCFDNDHRFLVEYRAGDNAAPGGIE